MGHYPNIFPTHLPREFAKSYFTDGRQLMQREKNPVKSETMIFLIFSNSNNTAENASHID